MNCTRYVCWRFDARRWSKRSIAWCTRLQKKNSSINYLHRFFCWYINTFERFFFDCTSNENQNWKNCTMFAFRNYVTIFISSRCRNLWFVCLSTTKSWFFVLYVECCIAKLIMSIILSLLNIFENVIIDFIKRKTILFKFELWLWLQF